MTELGLGVMIGILAGGVILFLLRPRRSAHRTSHRYPTYGASSVEHRLDQINTRVGNISHRLKRLEELLPDPQRQLADLQVEQPHTMEKTAPGQNPGFVNDPFDDTVRPHRSEPTREAVPEPTPVTRNRRIKVQLSGEHLILSRSLSPMAWLEVDNRGRGEVSINENAKIDQHMMKQWERFFVFREPFPDRRYKTVRPALITWDGSTKRGSCDQKGELSLA